MNKIVHGVIHGKTIHLTEDPGMADGQEVQVALTGVPSSTDWGEGIRRSAGGWADNHEMDAAMDTRASEARNLPPVKVKIKTPPVKPPKQSKK